MNLIKIKKYSNYLSCHGYLGSSKVPVWGRIRSFHFAWTWPGWGWGAGPPPDSWGPRVDIRPATVARDHSWMNWLCCLADRFWTKYFHFLPMEDKHQKVTCISAQMNAPTLSSLEMEDSKFIGRLAIVMTLDLYWLRVRLKSRKLQS